MMRKIIIILLLLASAPIIAQRWYPFHKKTQGVIAMDFRDSTLFFSPSIAMDAFSYDMRTGNYETGVIPGVGYGLKWNPYKWRTNYLLGVDLFAMARLYDQGGETNYFNIDLSPVVTVLNWIRVGVGPRFMLGLNGTENDMTWIFRIGISKTL